MTRKLLALTLGLLCLCGAQAQTESTIAASSIVNWTGTGTDQAILVVDFGSQAYAWGYRFDANDEPTVLNMITAIDAADPRLAYSIDWTTYEYRFYYVEWPLKLIDSVYRFKVDGTLADDEDEFSDYDLENGMVVKVSCATGNVWSTAITPATAAAMPINSTISADRIRYWVGEGADSAVVAISWGVPDTALAWGLLFDGSINIDDAILTVAAADPRLTADSTLTSIVYHDGSITMQLPTTGSYLQFRLNDNASAGFTTAVENGDFLKFGESAYGVGYDSTEYGGMWFPSGVVWGTAIQPATDPMADAEIAADDIVYWVGTGDNRVVMAINWADTALAWGYRFSDDSVTVQTVMEALAAADPRLSVETAGGYLTDIRFALNASDTLGITPGNYFESKRNHVSDAGMAQYLHDGDFEKWADPAAGIIVDSSSYEYSGTTYWFYIYTYPMTIHPVSQPGNSGIRMAQACTVTVYPNPASMMVHVQFDGALPQSEALLYDMSGRLMSRQALAAGTDHIDLPVAQLPTGAYLLQVAGNTVKVSVRH